jgi:hypothetical protein
MDTPAAMEAYFAHLVMESPATKWRTGLTAARQWRAYHDHPGSDATSLVEILAGLLPYRQAGSGLLGLWQAVIGGVQQLPAPTQLACWRAVYALAGHPPLQHRVQAMILLEIWERWVMRLPQTPLASWQLETAAQTVGPPLPYAYELFAIAWAMHNWCLVRLPEPQWMSLLLRPTS